MKKLIIIIVSVLVVLLVVGFAKDLIIKTSVEKGVEVVTEHQKLQGWHHQHSRRNKEPQAFQSKRIPGQSNARHA